MEGLQHPATEQHSRVNGYCEAKSLQDKADVRWTSPEAEADSCGAASVSETTDLREVKSRDSDDEEEKEDEGESLPSRGLKGEQKKIQKEVENQDSGHSKDKSASSSYTGENRKEEWNKNRNKIDEQ